MAQHMFPQESGFQVECTREGQHSNSERERIKRAIHNALAIKGKYDKEEIFYKLMEEGFKEVIVDSGSYYPGPVDQGPFSDNTPSSSWIVNGRECMITTGGS